MAALFGPNKLELPSFSSDTAANSAGANSEGSLYYNTTDKVIKTFNGSSWDQLSNESSATGGGTITHFRRRMNTTATNTTINFLDQIDPVTYADTTWGVNTGDFDGQYYTAPVDGYYLFIFDGTLMGNLNKYASFGISNNSTQPGTEPISFLARTPDTWSLSFTLYVKQEVSITMRLNAGDKVWSYIFGYTDGTKLRDSNVIFSGCLLQEL